MQAFPTHHIGFKSLSLACLLAGCFGSAPSQAATVYEHFTQLDPVTRTIVPDTYVVVDGTRIVASGSGSPPHEAGWTHRDMQGTWALPGFIDAHAHVTAAPLTIDLSSGRPVADMTPREPVTRFQALTALAFGVTTIRNPAGDPQANHDYARQQQAGTLVGPEALHAGFAFDATPIRGLTFQANDDMAWQAETAREKALGMQYLKLYAGLNEEELATGISIAHAHGLQTIGHLDQVSWTRAIELGIDALTHALPTSAELLPVELRDAYRQSRSPVSSTFMYQWFELVDLDGPEMRALIEQLVAAEVKVDLTLLVNELTYFSDELVRVMPQEDRRYFHPALMAIWESNMLASHYGWTPEDYTRAHAAMPKVLAFAQRLHHAGVQLLLGTDGSGGGPSYARELVLHQQAGLNTWDVLALATHLNAERLGIGARTGRLAPGYEADIVFLDANPLEDLAVVREVNRTLSNGTEYRFADVMALADTWAH